MSEFVGSTKIFLEHFKWGGEFVATKADDVIGLFLCFVNVFMPNFQHEDYYCDIEYILSYFWVVVYKKKKVNCTRCI